MMLYSIFLVCALGTKDCNKVYKVYAEIQRPPGLTTVEVSDEEMRKTCIENNREDHSFDNPVTNPQGKRVKITPTDCILGNSPPKDATPANEFAGYH